MYTGLASISVARATFSREDVLRAPTHLNTVLDIFRGHPKTPRGAQVWVHEMCACIESIFILLVLKSLVENLNPNPTGNGINIGAIPSSQSLTVLNRTGIVPATGSIFRFFVLIG